MLSDVVGKAVVVLLLVFGEVEGGGAVLAAKKEIHEGGIVETTMEIGAHTVIVGYAAFGRAVSFDCQWFICTLVYRR